MELLQKVRSVLGQRKINGYQWDDKHSGISAQELLDFLVVQKFRCAICRRKPGDGFDIFQVDHDHDTNKVRGLLCNQCNVGLGFLQDNYSIVVMAAKYLAASL